MCTGKAPPAKPSPVQHCEIPILPQSRVGGDRMARHASLCMCERVRLSAVSRTPLVLSREGQSSHICTRHLVQIVHSIKRRRVPPLSFSLSLLSKGCPEVKA